MSEAFVDVTWRGLEVGKRVKLHAMRPGEAYVDHTTPMPVGTLLALRTDEGVEIAATVVRVHEQVGGSTETPGMQIKPDLDGAAGDWWRARCAPEASAPRDARDPREAVVAKPTLTMSAVEVERVMAAAKADTPVEPVDPDAGKTEVMTAVDEATLQAIAAAAAEEATDPNLVDDGKRTMVMSAVDVSAIVEAAAAEADVSGASEATGEEPSSDDAGASGASGARGQGKKRRGKKRKS